MTLAGTLSCALGMLALWWICDAAALVSMQATAGPERSWIGLAGNAAELICGITLLGLRAWVSRMLLASPGQRRGPFDPGDYLAVACACLGATRRAADKTKITARYLMSGNVMFAGLQIAVFGNAILLRDR